MGEDHTELRCNQYWKGNKLFIFVVVLSVFCYKGYLVAMQEQFHLGKRIRLRQAGRVWMPALLFPSSVNRNPELGLLTP